MSVEDSSRVYAKYYDPPHETSATPAALAAGNKNPYPRLTDQKAFERGLLEKTVKSTNDIILYDNRIVVYKTEGDLMLYVVGGPEENELLLYNVVLALRDSLALLLQYVPLFLGPSVLQFGSSSLASQTDGRDHYGPLSSISHSSR